MRYRLRTLAKLTMLCGALLAIGSLSLMLLPPDWPLLQGTAGQIIVQVAAIYGGIGGNYLAIGGFVAQLVTLAITGP